MSDLFEPWRADAVSMGARPDGTTGDPFAARLAHGASGLLAVFNVAGVLDVADVQVARRMGRLAAVTDDEVLFAAALAVRAPRLGHVRADLATIAGTADADEDSWVDVGCLPWPEPQAWVRRVAASDLVGTDRPLRLEGTALYLDRYWAQERQVAADLRERAGSSGDGPHAAVVDIEVLAHGLDRLFGGNDEPDLARAAAAMAVQRRLTVIAGGPGTGKTTTVARFLALVDEQASVLGARPPLVALAAPTGKAAARLEEAVHEQARAMPAAPALRERLLALRGTTVHRLLGSRPGSRTRFRHDRLNRLPFDVVVVDETSMVSLTLMARLVEAVRPDARLVLVGDPEQLASVEAGAVLGDIVGPAVDAPHGGRPCGANAVSEGPDSVEGPTKSGIGGSIVVLRRVHRFGEAIAGLADAIRRGDGDVTIGLLRAGDAALSWVAVDVVPPAAALPVSGPAGVGPEAARLDALRSAAVHAGRRVREAAEAGHARDALVALGEFRLLCAHRHGPAGATTWMTVVERWLSSDGSGLGRVGPWYPGRPLLVTANDYSLRLYNGDTGVVVARADGRTVAAFDRGGDVMEVSPSRLAAVETVYAMTVHKAQGSQFDSVAVVLPDRGSPILTRELLYTAVSRARERVMVVGSEASVRSAVDRPIARASGLRQRLWEED